MKKKPSLSSSAFYASLRTIILRRYLHSTLDIENAAHKMWWYYAEAVSGEQQGNAIDGLHYLKNENILSSIDWLFVMGSTLMQEAIAKELVQLKNSLNPALKTIANINIPMQCMMQGICGQCLIVSENGPKFCCKNQEIRIQEMPFDTLQNRSKQNSLLEKISRLWLNHITAIN